MHPATRQGLLLLEPAVRLQSWDWVKAKQALKWRTLALDTPDGSLSEQHTVKL